METDEIEDQKHFESKEISKAKHKKERFIFADLSDQEQDQPSTEIKQKGVKIANIPNKVIVNNSETKEIEIKQQTSVPPLKQNLFEIKDRLIDTPDPMSVITSDSYPKIVKINSSPRSP